MASTTSQFMSVMQADDFMGPYEVVHKMYKPYQMDSGDFSLYVDQETNKAYFIFERPHFEMVTATLTDDYTEVSEEYSRHFQQMLPPHTREAPAHFERNGKHYLFTSGTSGYLPNPSKIATFTDFHGEYMDLGDPHIGDPTGTSFSSQITCVLNIPGTDLYIACADRWKPGKLNQWMAMKSLKMIERGMKRRNNKINDVNNESPKETVPLPGKLKRHFDNTSKSTYVWLPIEWQGDKPVIRWHDEWRLEDFMK